MTAPVVSVVVAAYNGARFLPETIASLTAQTMPDWEAIVVDDCSTDDTRAVLATIDEPRLRVVHAAANGGPAVARTIAMAHARGRFVAGLDQDDLCRPDRFARQLAYLDAHPDTVLVASAAERFGAAAAPRAPDPQGDLADPDVVDWRMMVRNPFVWSSVMMRGAAARALDPFERDAVRCAEDFDLYHRIRRFGRLARTDAPLVRYRQHADGLSTSAEARMLASAASVLAAAYADAFGDGADRAGELMIRYGSEYRPVPDAATLVEMGLLLDRLADALAHVPRAHAHAAALWWRIARGGLRAGSYGPLEVMHARTRLAPRAPCGPRPRLVARTALGSAILPDLALGTGRRLRRWVG